MARIQFTPRPDLSGIQVSGIEDVTDQELSDWLRGRMEGRDPWVAPDPSGLEFLGSIVVATWEALRGTRPDQAARLLDAAEQLLVSAANEACESDVPWIVTLLHTLDLITQSGGRVDAGTITALLDAKWGASTLDIQSLAAALLRNARPADQAKALAKRWVSVPALTQAVFMSLAELDWELAIEALPVHVEALVADSKEIGADPGARLALEFDWLLAPEGAHQRVPQSIVDKLDRLDLPPAVRAVVSEASAGLRALCGDRGRSTNSRPGASVHAAAGGEDEDCTGLDALPEGRASGGRGREDRSTPPPRPEGLDRPRGSDLRLPHAASR